MYGRQWQLRGIILVPLLVAIQGLVVTACSDSSAPPPPPTLPAYASSTQSTPASDPVTAPGASTPLKTDKPVPAMPAIETKFIEIISTAQNASTAANNDMQRGGIKAKRDHNICELLQSLSVANWVGQAATIDSNSDGKGVLEIKIAENISVETWNNSLSDFEDHTLLEPESKIFKMASAMTVGQDVIFSGSFLRDDENCIKEQSLTLHGKVEKPEFVFRFASVTSPTENDASQINADPAPPMEASASTSADDATDNASSNDASASEATSGSQAAASSNSGLSNAATLSPRKKRNRLVMSEQSNTSVPGPEPAQSPTAPLPYDLASVRATDPQAADHIAAYCAAAVKAIDRRDEIQATCMRNETNAWRRLIVEKEFPSITPGVAQLCAQPPFPDSYVAKEQCAKYELQR